MRSKQHSPGRTVETNDSQQKLPEPFTFGHLSLEAGNLVRYKPMRHTSKPLRFNHWMDSATIRGQGVLDFEQA